MEWLERVRQFVLHGNPGYVGTIMGACAIAAAWCAWRTHRNILLARTIEDIPTSSVRSVYQGYVELKGIGLYFDNDPVNAPLSKRPCIWYRYTVERRKDDGGWEVVESGTSGETFLLDDGTGHVVIDPDGAEVTVKIKQTWTARSSGVASVESMRFARRLGVPGALAGDLYRHTEERLLPGKRLYVLGLLRNLTSLNDGPTLKEDIAEILREWKTDPEELNRRFDLDGDGHLSQLEWKLARIEARREALAARREEQQRNVEGVNIISRPHDLRRPYLISAFHESEIIKRYRLFAVALAFGFLTLGSFALWIFNLRFLPLLKNL
jgi:hypothetical protein